MIAFAKTREIPWKSACGGTPNKASGAVNLILYKNRAYLTTDLLDRHLGAILGRTQISALFLDSPLQ